MSKKLNRLEEKVKRGRVTHEQHTEQFRRELNKPKEVKEPFRILDEIWIIGKHKGKKISDTPKDYIIWILKEFKNLSKTHTSILNNHLNR